MLLVDRDRGYLWDGRVVGFAHSVQHDTQLVDGTCASPPIDLTVHRSEQAVEVLDEMVISCLCRAFLS